MNSMQWWTHDPGKNLWLGREDWNRKCGWLLELVGFGRFCVTLIHVTLLNLGYFNFVLTYLIEWLVVSIAFRFLLNQLFALIWIWKRYLQLCLRIFKNSIKWFSKTQNLCSLCSCFYFLFKSLAYDFSFTLWYYKMIIFILSLVGGKIKGEKRVENWVLNFLLSDWMYCALW
jgi:hypothetical protein